MFPIDYKTGFLVYVVLALAGLGAVLIADFLRERRRAWRLSEAHLCRCPDCHHNFILPRTLASGECPHCGRTCHISRRR